MPNAANNRCLLTCSSTRGSSPNYRLNANHGSIWQNLLFYAKWQSVQSMLSLFFSLSQSHACGWTRKNEIEHLHPTRRFWRRQGSTASRLKSPNTSTWSPTGRPSSSPSSRPEKYPLLRAPMASAWPSRTPSRSTWHSRGFTLASSWAGTRQPVRRSGNGSPLPTER